MRITGHTSQRAVSHHEAAPHDGHLWRSAYSNVASVARAPMVRSEVSAAT